MPVVPLPYRFQQPFRVPARDAFAWCTDYRASDGALFADRTLRSVRRIAPDTVILTDTTFPGGRRLTIRRLVRIQADRLAWTNTHLDGPYRYSQHWYRVRPDGPGRSRLEFEGLRLERRARPLSPRERARRANAVRRTDAAEWRQHLAPALERDVRGR